MNGRISEHDSWMSIQNALIQAPEVLPQPLRPLIKGL